MPVGMMGHSFALEPPGLSLVCSTSSRDPWWLQGKSSYQWSTESAKGRKAHSGLGLRAQLTARSATTFLGMAREPVVHIVRNSYERCFHPVTSVPSPDCSIVWRLTKKSPEKGLGKLHLRSENALLLLPRVHSYTHQ